MPGEWNPVRLPFFLPAGPRILTSQRLLGSVKMLDRWLFLVVRDPGNHEFPDHEKNDFDLDFLLLMSCAFIHEFPFFKIKQQAGNCFTRYLQRRKKQFPDKQFLCLLGNHSECCIWILKPLQYRTSHMALKKSNLGIHDASKHLNWEVDSQLDQIIFDLGIHDVDKNGIGSFFLFLQNSATSSWQNHTQVYNYW